MNDDKRQSRRSLRTQAADELLVAETVFRDAYQQHERERSELSRRALEAAEGQLREAEEAAAMLARESMPLACRRCGCLPSAERWRADERTYRELQPENGIAIRLAIGAPEWAAEYAVQGVTQVTRYTCSSCGNVVAILAVD